MKRKLGICTRYTRQGASSRLRYHLYASALEEAGFEAEFHPFFTERYLQNLYSGGGKSRRGARETAGTRPPPPRTAAYRI